MTKMDKADEEQTVSKLLLRLDDQLTIFNENCSFLCDAFSRLIEDHPHLSQASINGCHHHTRWLKQQTHELLQLLTAIRASTKKQQH